ncbi:hypothetical protein Cflav_PD2646 [Pedosphaera parvula Ellin514]|uniref:Uncharacterized protein n=1 Tax=Pedosphaera parvula (strain Ellin514) TaxID=320771 RepID=B9XKI7_PEDPL|nr:hypothetical protein Cflav_PD2646 [Pedosphaera parvula Ellin514]
MRQTKLPTITSHENRTLPALFFRSSAYRRLFDGPDNELQGTAAGQEPGFVANYQVGSELKYF